MDNDEKFFAKCILFGMFLILATILGGVMQDNYHQRRMSEKNLCYQFNTYLPCDIKK